MSWYLSRGIYRVNGAKSRVEKLCQAFENGKDLVELSDLSPHDIGNVLKLYLRQLPEPLILYRYYNDFIGLAKESQAVIIEEKAAARALQNQTKSQGQPGGEQPRPGGTQPAVEGEQPPLRTSQPGGELPNQPSIKLNRVLFKIRDLLRQLPPAHYRTLRFLTAHLHRVTEQAGENKMTASNLGIIFGPTLVKPRQTDAEVSLSSLVDYPYQALMVELLVRHFQMIFDVASPVSSSSSSSSSPTTTSTAGHTSPRLTPQEEQRLSRQSTSLLDIKESAKVYKRHLSSNILDEVRGVTTGRTGPDRTGPDRTGPDRTGPDRTGPDRTGPDRTGPDRRELTALERLSGVGSAAAGAPKRSTLVFGRPSINLSSSTSSFSSMAPRVQQRSRRVSRPISMPLERLPLPNPSQVVERNSQNTNDAAMLDPTADTIMELAEPEKEKPRIGGGSRAPLRRQIKAKPAGAQPCGVTSATARRILQSLERMSSPLADAKRIPSTVSSPLSTSLDGSTLDRSHFQAQKKRLDSPLPPVQRLVIPASASVSGNRSMSFRPSLIPGCLTRTPRDTPTRQSPLIPEAVAGPSQSTSSSLPTYPLSSTPAARSTGSGGGKMKRERTSTRPSSKRPEDEIAELPALPAISLLINTSISLPSFSFSTTKPTATVTSTPVLEEPVTNEVPLTTAPSTPPSTPFTFSSPIVMTTATSPPSFSPSSGFTFSAPVVKTGLSLSNGKMATPVVAAVKHAASESMEEIEGPFKPAKVLKQGSVLDLLKGPGFAVPVTQTSPVPKAPQETPALSTAPSLGDLFKVPTGSWDCDVCMVQNKPTDTKCVACVTPRPNSSLAKTHSKPFATVSGLEGSTTTTTTTAAGFGALFTKPAGSWDCDTCLVQNKPQVVKCVACETAKPGTGVKATLTLPAFSEAKTLPAAAPLLGFGDKFKKPEGAWECDVCMVQNKVQDIKCVSCMSTKPANEKREQPGATAAPPSLTPAPVSTTPLLGFGAQFKKPEGAWECDVCCVQNKGADQACVACQTHKPGVKVEPKAFGSSSFGIQSLSDTGSGGFKFGLGASSDSASASGGFKFGGTLSDSSSSGGFKFGGTLSEFEAP
ncbi:nuclear pore complex protein Nup153 [Coregonus clupeaformis]|uniref:nuclear pore complex protein Nup153 n=1 Tax=Coregonus clupeaformis TaxID=59861 RepID=UPI001E1C46A2|nr:nuclear pore complex protein Nup153 [Coregonus clupeaformis]